MTALHVTGLRVVLGHSEILHGIDLNVTQGEWVGIIGPNGAGKTTLLRAIHGTVPSSGTIRLGSDDAAPMSRAMRARAAALVPQRPVTPSGMRVFDYVLLGRSPHISYLAVESPHDIEVARGALAALDLQRFADRRLEELSGGELQQVVLARALAQEAPLLLLDEPTSALDVGHQLQVLALIDRLRREHSLTILSAMHDLTLAAQFCDRLVLMDGGAIITDGLPSEVLVEETIAAHYDATVRVIDDGEGRLAVVPIRTNGARPPVSSQ